MKIDLFNLADLDKAIAITDNHKENMKKRMTKIMEKVRQEAVFEANRLYQSASYAGFKDVVINATPVHVEDGKLTFTLRAMGSTTLFIELARVFIQVLRMKPMDLLQVATLSCMDSMVRNKA